MSKLGEGKKVFVGMSGGVDSSVSAYLLLEQGYDVTGIYMKNWSDDFGIEGTCPWEEELEAAKSVADKLGIEFRSINFEREYRDLVIEDFFKQYKIGNTPNPDILCNKFIKFDKFLAKCIELGADYIATGHYCKTDFDGRLYKPKDSNKDQTYFLSQVTSDALKKTIFPLGDLNKSEVRAIAKKQGFENHDRPDSQGICFVGEVDIREFLSQRLTVKKGYIKDIDSGEVVGEHDGIWFYTLGQRKGMALGGFPKPYFVVSKDVENNILYVGQGETHKELWKRKVSCDNFHYINYPTDFENLSASIRYRSKDSKVTVLEMNEGGKVSVEFVNSQWAPALSQYLVVYQGNECIGGGEITYC